MTDWGMSGRVDSYSFSLVDPFSLVETGEKIDAEEGASTITWGVGTENVCSASLSLVGEDLGNRLVRVSHGILLPTGEQYQEVLGTFFVNSSRSKAVNKSVRQTCDSYSTLWRFTQDVLSTDIYKPRGYVVVDEAREIIEADGGKLVVMPGAHAEATHTMNVWWTIGTNKGDLLTNLANWTGNEIGVNDLGFITWSPYIPPETRPVSYSFEDGVNCVYKSGYELDDNRSDAVNRVVAYFSSNEPQKDETPLYPYSDSVTVDLPDYHPFSYSSIGRRATYALNVSQPCSHSELESQATRYLYEHCGAQRFVTIENVGIPGLRVGQKVHYRNMHDSEEGVDGDYIVDQISMTLGPGAMCQTKLREA